MKREEIEEIVPGITKEQIDALLDKAGNDIESVKSRAKAKEADLKNKLDAANEAISNYEIEAKKNMTAEQQIEAREKELADMANEFARKSNELDAKAIFADAGIPAEQIGPLLANVVSEDAERTKALAESIVATMDAKAKAVDAAVRDELLKANPAPSGGSGGGNALPTTVKEFLALDVEQQIALKDANPNLISQLKKD